MTHSTAMQPAHVGHKSTLGEGEEGLLHSAAEAEEQALIQKIEEQAALLLKESEVLHHLSHQLMERSHGEAHQEAMHARTQADTMRAGALAAKNEIQAARTQARDGKGRLPTHKLSAMAADIGLATRFGTQEKATVEKATAYYGAIATVEQAAKAAPSLAHTVISAVKQVTHASAVAVVGPPVFHGFGYRSATPFGNMLERMSAAGEQVAEEVSQQWTRITVAISEVADDVMESAPVKRAVELGNAAWSHAKHASAAVASGVGEFVQAPIETSKKVAKTAVAKVSQLADKAVEAVGSAKDKAVDYATNKLAAAKKMASGLWPFGEKSATAEADKPSPSKSEGLGAMARALQQATTCKIMPKSLACKAVSAAAVLAPTRILLQPELTEISAIIGA